MTRLGRLASTALERTERVLRWRLAAPAASGLERALNATVFSRSRSIRGLTLPLRLIRRRCLLVRSGLELSATVVRGRDDAGVERRILYAGEREAREWMIRRLLPSEREEGPSLHVRPWGLRGLVEARRREVDLVVLELNRCLRPVPRDLPAMESPRWVRLWIPLERTWEATASRFSRSARKQIRAIRSQGFEHRVVPAAEVFEEFHQRHHLPFMEARHRELAIFHDRRELEGFARRGTILQVLDGGRWVAGMLNAVVGRDLRCVVLGVLDGDPGLIRRNALKALFYFTIQWAVEQELHAIDLGRARPVEDDPVLLQKRRWGARVEPDPWEESRFVIAPGAGADFFDAVRRRHAFLSSA